MEEKEDSKVHTMFNLNIFGNFPFLLKCTVF